MFDLSQEGMENRRDLYAGEGWTQERVVDHIALRVLDAEAMAAFYAEVFEFVPLNKAPGDPNVYLSDGRITLELIPWRLAEYANTNIGYIGLDHIGFRVESIEALKRDMEAVTVKNYRFRPASFGDDEAGRAYRAVFARTCPLGTYHMADLDGVMIDVRQ